MKAGAAILLFRLHKDNIKRRKMSDSRSERIKILSNISWRMNTIIFRDTPWHWSLLKRVMLPVQCSILKRLLSLNPSFLAAYYQLGKALERDSGANGSIANLPQE
jgi:hypothetical protein